jgi:hypothetical protein
MRRDDALKIIGTVGLQCAFPFEGDELYGQHAHTPEARAAATPKAEYLRGEDLEIVTRAAELILPGAREAFVADYIDLVVRDNAGHRKTFAEGLAWLKERRFLTLGEDAQFALLEGLCREVDQGDTRTPERQFFRVLKNLTADGFYTSREGLMTELGYKGNQVLAEFPECTIDEH